VGEVGRGGGGGVCMEGEEEQERGEADHLISLRRQRSCRNSEFKKGRCAAPKSRKMETRSASDASGDFCVWRSVVCKRLCSLRLAWLGGRNWAD
jgi:hypothetical protein